MLDFLITRHFYESSAKVKRDLGLCMDLRSVAVNNECFARVAVQHNLQWRSFFIIPGTFLIDVCKLCIVCVLFVN